jgi:hypothetical protein
VIIYMMLSRFTFFSDLPSSPAKRVGNSFDRSCSWPIRKELLRIPRRTEIRTGKPRIRERGWGTVVDPVCCGYLINAQFIFFSSHTDYLNTSMYPFKVWTLSPYFLGQPVVVVLRTSNDFSYFRNFLNFMNYLSFSARLMQKRKLIDIVNPRIFDN